MVGVAQLVECKIVILVVVGSSPIVHPMLRTPARRRPNLVLAAFSGPVKREEQADW